MVNQGWTEGQAAKGQNSEGVRPAAIGGFQRFRWDQGAGVLLVIFFGLPVAAVLIQAFGPDPEGLKWGSIFRSGALWNTWVLGLAVAAVSAGLAVPLAWIAERTMLQQVPGWNTLFLIPFMTPPYLTSMGWIVFMEPGGGYLARWMPWTAPLQREFFSVAGLIWIMALHLYPVMYAGLRLAIRATGRDLDEAGRVHGISPGRRWWRIHLPLWLPVLFGTGTFVFVKSIGEFGSPVVFGSLLHFPVLTTAIYQNLVTWPVDFTAASRLAAILFAMGLFVWWAQHRYVRHRRYALVSGGIRRAYPTAAPLVNAVAGVFGGWVVLNALVIPLGSMAVSSVLRVQGMGLAPDNLTFIHYVDLFRRGGDAAGTLLTSFELAAGAGVVATVLAVALALMARFFQGWWVRWIDFLTLVPNTVPDLLLAVGLILVWNAPWWPIPLYNQPGILMVAFVVLFLPLAYRYVVGQLEVLAPSLWEAGAVHGMGKWKIFSRIVGPLILPGVLTGWMMVFAVSFRDLVIPMLMSPPGVGLVSTYIYGQFDQGSLPSAMAMAVLTVAVAAGAGGVAEWMAGGWRSPGSPNGGRPRAAGREAGTGRDRHHRS